MNKLESLNNDLFQPLDLEESKQLIGGALTSQGTVEATWSETGGSDFKADFKIDF